MEGIIGTKQAAVLKNRIDLNIPTNIFFSLNEILPIFTKFRAGFITDKARESIRRKDIRISFKYPLGNRAYYPRLPDLNRIKIRGETGG
jgi:hypothetical protein